MRIVNTDHFYELLTIPETAYCGFFQSYRMAENAAALAEQVGGAQVCLIFEHEIWPA